MDPNATLSLLRAAINGWRTSDDEADQDDHAAQALILFEDLDGWLSRGGFLPDAWNELRVKPRGPRVGVVMRSQLGDDWRPSTHISDPEEEA